MTEMELVRIAKENDKNPFDLMKEYCPCGFEYTARCDKSKCSNEHYENKHPFECTACWVASSKGKSLDEELKELQEKIKPKEETEKVNHPHYYQQPNRRECIEEMRLMFGDEHVYWWCVMTAYKYRFRAGNKDGNPATQDEKKAEWYLDYAENLKDKI